MEIVLITISNVLRDIWHEADNIAKQCKYSVLNAQFDGVQYMTRCKYG